MQKWSLDSSTTEFDLLGKYPDLDGRYKVTLIARSESLTASANSVIRYKKPVIPRPEIIFTETAFANAEPSSAVDLESRAGGRFTEEEIEWTWELNGVSSDDYPESFTWKLQAWDPRRKTPANDPTPITSELSSRSKELTIAELIAAAEDDDFLFFGETCVLTLTATWEDESRQQAVTYLTFPRPELKILGYKGHSGTEEDPRIVKKDDRIKISNWMHPRNDKSMRYYLSLQRWGGDTWQPWTEAERPLELVHTKTGAYIAVKETPADKLRFTVELLYGKSRSEDGGIPIAEAQGYLEPEGRPWLPIFIALFALTAIGLFTWNLISRRS